ncbi:MAG: hypothetical protein Q4F21_11745 [Lachnospiraceae bacterium]|nr:hypothetical protein [Lachnospiraceae bacterium]
MKYGKYESRTENRKKRKGILRSFRNLEKRFDEKAERFAFRHPYLAFFAMFYGMPFFVLAAVCICSAVITLPAAWLLNWL